MTEMSPQILVCGVLICLAKDSYLEPLSLDPSIQQHNEDLHQDDFNHDDLHHPDVNEHLEHSSPVPGPERVGTRIVSGDYDGEFNATNGDFNGTIGEMEEESVNITAYNNMLNATWLNLVGVMDLFTQREHDNCSAIQALTAAYRYTLKQQKKLKTLPSYMKKPFITIEGLDRHKRDLLAKRLSLRLQGHVILNPPDTFDVIYKHFPNNTVLYNGFYVLSTYIAALHVRYVTQQAPAIAPGYWLGRAAITIARNFIDKPPPYESKFWVWPRDLVKPNIVFYLTDRFSLHQFEDHKLIQRYLHVFDNWVDPKCIPLTNTQSIESLMDEMQPYLDEL